jgi:hypothetical protein
MIVGSQKLKRYVNLPLLSYPETFVQPVHDVRECFDDNVNFCVSYRITFQHIVTIHGFVKTTYNNYTNKMS